jgi:proton glutamate symport protein
MLWKVLGAICLGVLVGTITGKTATIFGFISFYEVFELASQLFLNSLTLLAIPMVAAAIISGLGQLHGETSLKKLGGKTFGFYLLTISIAVILGVSVFNLINPGLSYTCDVSNLCSGDTSHATHLSHSPSKSVFQLLYKLIPPNIIEAAASGNMIGVIFFSLLFGFALIKVPAPYQASMVKFWKGLFETFMRVTQILMRALPLGVFFLMAKVTALQGVQSFSGLLWFFLTVAVGLFIFCFVLIPLLLKAVGISPVQYLKAVYPALITAFSTSSSAATLPVTLECVEKKAGVSNRVCSFVIPLGLSMNMAGSALYECVAVLFIAQVYGVSLSFSHQILVAVLSLITSMGVGGIPSGSLVGVMIILQSLGLPTEAIALILPLDRILDMCRTAANVYSDASCAVLIAHSEGEKILCKPSLNEIKI